MGCLTKHPQPHQAGPAGPRPRTLSKLLLSTVFFKPIATRYDRDHKPSCDSFHWGKGNLQVKGV
jgi:hypothetical protein